MFNVAIDGPSSSGKGTIAKEVAQKLGYTHLDTGAMYRTAALACVLENISLDNEKGCLEILKQSQIELKNNKVYLNGKDVTQRIRYEDMSEGASKISVHPNIRKHIVSQQQKIASKLGYVLEGRDITSVVLPNAAVKIFLTADVEVRAQRRYQQLKNINPNINYDDVYMELEQRDYRDTHREESPLIKVDEAVEIDSTYLTIDEVVDMIMNYIESRNLL